MIHRHVTRAPPAITAIQSIIAVYTSAEFMFLCNKDLIHSCLPCISLFVQSRSILAIVTDVFSTGVYPGGKANTVERKFHRTMLLTPAFAGTCALSCGLARLPTGHVCRHTTSLSW
eukprot:m.1009159 g.1009159  ORF g.1009159 m.1009159 type:complete len:116 (+) comp24058_c0_seq78:2063-2410(+)